MSKNAVATFLSLIVTIIIGISSAILVFGDSGYASVYFAISKEEKEKYQENNKDVEFVVIDMKSFFINAWSDFEANDLKQFLKIYQRRYLKTVVPPPKISDRIT